MKGLERRACVTRGALPAVAFGVALVCGLATPALAQVAPVVTNTPSAPPDTVGPRELRDFSLGGTRTIPQALPADASPPAPRSTQPVRPAPRPEAAPASRPVAAPAAPPQRNAPETAARTASRRPDPTAGTPAAQVTIPLPSADPLSRDATPAPQPRTQVTPFSATERASPTPVGADDDGTSYWPWLLALGFLAAGGILYLLRERIAVGRRAEPALAGAPFDLAPPRTPPAPEPLLPQAPQPAPASALPRAVPGGITVARPRPFPPEDAESPAPPSRAPAPATVPPRPAGIVSTRLRPWLDISFVPARAVIDEQRASVQFDIIVTNSGNAPARDVLVEACMINAGPEQDAELRRFFEQPAGQGERIDAIPPLGKIQLNSSVTMSLEQTRAYEIGGRKLFVPLIAFNALYSWGSNKGQSSASYLVGRGHVEGDGDAESRMAPLRLDLGPRIFRDLDTRRHPLGLRV